MHTLLRLPTGIFYAQGVKANVLFFDNKPKDGKVHTKGVWIFDLRTNKHFTLKTKPLRFDDLQEFIAAYHPQNRHQRKPSERFRYFDYDTLVSRDKASPVSYTQLDVYKRQEFEDPTRSGCRRFRQPLQVSRLPARTS